MRFHRTLDPLHSLWLNQGVAAERSVLPETRRGLGQFSRPIAALRFLLSESEPKAMPTPLCSLA